MDRKPTKDANKKAKREMHEAVDKVIDQKKKEQLAADMKAGKAYPVDPNLDKDYYGVRKRFAT